MPAKLHIVCLDAPSPPNYGGAIDMHYKIRALAESGREIVLHYFDYKAGRSAQGLEAYCAAIHKYGRKGFLRSLASRKPYIVASRNNDELLRILSADDAPVLLEGVHCTGLLPYLYGKRKVVVRMHNDEAAYYRGLAKNERSLVRRIYFEREAALLHSYQRSLPRDLPLACVVQNDCDDLRERYGFTHLPLIPSFTPWQQISGAEGRGAYCLYHGNFEVAENCRAAEWLLGRVFKGIGIPLTIAGKGIPPGLLRYDGIDGVRAISNPDQQTMEQLVRDAQVHVLPSFNTTGLKLKLLHSLFAGRHCLTNAAGIAGTAFHGALSTAETPEDWQEKIKDLWQRPFIQEDRDARSVVAAFYSNRNNAAALNAWL